MRDETPEDRHPAGQGGSSGSTTAPYTTTWAPPTAGAYHLTAVATDSAGGVTTSAARTITVQGANQLPNVSLTSPLANQSFTAPANIALAAIASDADGTIARVEFFQGSTLIGSATAAPYGAAWNNVPAGSYILTARATDDRGATRSSTAIPITVTGGGPSILYLHGDHLGTPRVATNEANVVVWRNPPTTEPFGMALPEEDPDGDGRPTVINLRFPGQYFDRETLLHYNYLRDHYFPELGRYGQSDPIGVAGGINTFAYVGGNPVSKIDPLGLLEHFMMELNGKSMSSVECACRDSYPAFSGNPPYRNNPDATTQANVGPAPEGWYYIVDRPQGGIGGRVMSFFSGKDEWFALYRDDGTSGDDTVEKGVVRNEIRLHPKGPMGNSFGCVTLENQADYDRLRERLMNTTTGIIPGTNIKYYGTILLYRPNWGLW